jgi:hypothetical protein
MIERDDGDHIFTDLVMILGILAAAIVFIEDKQPKGAMVMLHRAGAIAGELAAARFSRVRPSEVGPDIDELTAQVGAICVRVGILGEPDEGLVAREIEAVLGANRRMNQ